jgi:iron complex outermembrane receptor protein
MNQSFTRLWLLGFTLFFTLPMMAQMTVGGTVIDGETGEPLIGATILVKGTFAGAITDLDGKYTIEVEDGDVLVFSYVGYGEQEIPIDGSSSYDVTMVAGTLIDEVVVIGYGSVKKGDLTGAVSQVGEEDFNQGAITSPEQLLDGRVSGVQIVTASGAPGASARINIRGASSIRSGNDPLIVIDGVQLDNRSADASGDISSLGRTAGSNPFNFIDPNEIESIEVLKDASATAIYGSRGANGVILITTKKGRSGAPSVEYSTQQGFSSILKRPDYLSADEYRSALETEGIGNANDFGDDVDALDEILRTGYTNQHNFSVGGGNDQSTYRVFASYFDQTGIIEGTGIEKYTGGVKGSFKTLKDRVNITAGVNVANTIQDDAPISDDAGFEGSLIGAALQWNPTNPLVVNDSFNQDILENRNPLALVEYVRDQTNITRVIGNLGIDVNLTKGLDYRFALAFDQARGERRAYANPLLNLNDIVGRGQALVGNNRLGSVQYTHTLNYQKDVGSTSLNFLGGYEYLNYTNRGTTIFVTDLDPNFPFDLTDALQSASNDNQRVESFREPDIELQSFFARAIINSDDRYLLTATLRADGSSKVGTNNTYGIFPSFAAAWNISNEDFAPDAFDNLKLRLGWGVTGNQEFPAGAAQEYFEYENGNLTQRNNPNPDLKWEQTIQLNGGIDFAVADYKVTGSLDVFSKKTEDLILFVPLAQPNPSSEGRIYSNVDGTITNTGVELSLNAYIMEKENFTWDVTLNATYLANEVDGFSSPINTGAINGQGLTGAFAQRVENGQSLFAYYLPVWVGFDEQGLSIYEDPTTGGTTQIATVASTKQFVGDPLPDALLGLATRLEIGDLSILANINGVFGYQVYNNTANAVFVKGNLSNGRNVTSESVGNGESLNNSYPASTRYLEDGDHVRLSNLTLAYSFNNLPDWLKGLQVSVTGTNLFLITGYSGFDPLVDTNKEIDGIPSFGIEYTPYPTARTVLFGLNAKF